MAISVFMHYHSGRDAVVLYDSVINEMRQRGRAVQEGLVYHLAAVVPHGMFVADAWETREAFNVFAAAKTVPLTEKRGLMSPEVEFADVYRMIAGAGSSTGGCGVVAHFDGDADALLRQYDELGAQAGLNQAPPPGLIVRWCAKRPTGLCTVDHWLSRENFENFRDGVLTQTMRSVGMPSPRFEFYDVYNTVDGRAAHEQQPA
jgi:hypothetical protein